MATVQLTRTQQDGQFTMNLDSTEWTAWGGNFVNKQLNKISMPNIFDNAISYYNSDDSTPIVHFYQYSNATETWVEEYHFDDLINMNIVIAPDSKVYVCDDNIIKKIPNYDISAMIVNRVNSNINAGNRSIYKMIGDGSASEIKGYPLCPMFCYTNSYGRGGIWQIIIGANYSTEEKKMYLTGIRDQMTAATYTLYDGRMPNVSNTLKLANHGIEDLTIRVAVLEGEVANIRSDLQNLKKTVEQHSKVLQDLPALISAVNADVTRLYVSR